jgi:hypothetical protein
MTTARLAKQLADVEARMIRAAQKGENAFKASNSRAAKSFDQVAAGANKMSGAVAARFQNVGYQLQDIAVQIAGGQGVARALGQQLPQLAGGFGLVGVAIGTLAAVAIPLFATFGLGSDKIKTLEEDLKGLAEAMQAFRAAQSAALATPEALTEDFGKGIEQAREVLEIQQQIAQVRAEAALQKSAGSLADLFGDFDAALQIGNSAVEATERLYALQDVAEAIGVEFEENIPAIEAVAQALQAVSEADGPREQADAMEQLRGAIIDAADGGKALNDEALQVISNLTDAELAALALASVDIAGPIGAGANEAARLAQNLAAASAASLAYGKIQNSGLSGPDAARRSVLPLNAPGLLTGTVASGAGGVFKPAKGSGGGRRGGGGGGGGGGGRGNNEAEKEAKAFEKIFEQGQREIEQLEQRLSLVGKTAEETARLTAEYELLNAAKQAGLNLDQVSAQTGQTLRDQIAQQAQAIADLTVKYSLAKQQAEFFDDIQDQLQDGFIDAIVSGQDFAGVLADVAKQLAKAFLQAALFGKGPLTGLFGGSPGKGLFSLLGFAEGGYTGNGTKYQPAGIVHKGEYVFDAKATRRIGVRKLEALRGGMKGFANGGLVGGGGGGRAGGVNVTARPQVTVAFVDSDDKLGEFLQTSPTAESAVMQIVRRNGGGK